MIIVKLILAWSFLWGISTLFIFLILNYTPPDVLVKRAQDRAKALARLERAMDEFGYRLAESFIHLVLLGEYLVMQAKRKIK